MAEEPKQLTHEEFKNAVKEAIKEWIDERYRVLGRWTFGTFMAALFGALVYFTLTGHGWHK